MLFKKSEKNVALNGEETAVKSGGEGSLAVNSRRVILFGVLLIQFVPLVVLGGVMGIFTSPKAFLFMAATQLIFYAWLFAAFHLDQFRPQVNPLLIAIGVYLFALTLSTLFGADPAESFWSEHGRMTGLLFQLHLFAFFLVSSAVFRSESEWRFLLGTAVFIAVLVSAWGLADNYNLEWPLQVYDRVGIVSLQVRDFSQSGSTLGNKSFLGTYLLINSFFALYLFSTAGRKGKLIWGICFMLIATGIMLNPGGRAMRGAFIAGLLLIMLLYFAFQQRHRFMRISAAALIFLALAAAFFFGISTFQEDSFTRRQMLALEGMPERIIHWEIAWEGFKERPLLGWGPENFETAAQRHYNPELLLPGYGFSINERWDRAHNVFFDHLATAGLLGLIAYVAVLGAAILLLWRAWARDRNRVGYLWRAAIFTALYTAHFIQNLTVFDTPASYIFFYMSLAYVAATADPGNMEEGEKKRVWSAKPGVYSMLLFATLSVLLIISINHFVVRPFLAGRLVRLALQEEHFEEGSLVEIFQQANALTPLGRKQNRLYLAGGAIGRLEQFTARQDRVSAAVARSGRSEAIEAFELKNSEDAEFYLAELSYMISEVHKSTEEAPLNFWPYYDLGRIYLAYSIGLEHFTYGREDRLEKSFDAVLAAEELYRQAIVISPCNVPAYWKLAETLIRQGELSGNRQKYRDALNLATKKISIEPRLIESHILALRAAVLLEDETEIKEIYDRALTIDQGWQSALDEYRPGQLSSQP